MRTFTSCDDATRWRQAVFAFTVNRSNASKTEKHLITVRYRQEIGQDKFEFEFIGVLTSHVTIFQSYYVTARMCRRTGEEVVVPTVGLPMP